MSTAAAKRVLERTYDADVEDVWEMWTTKEGIEAWWGPDGFAVTVQHLDLKPGGWLHYTMTAVGKDQIAFMKQHGMPLATQTRIRFVTVDAPRKLAYVNVVDFVPGTAPYDNNTVVELAAAAGGKTKLVLTLDAMHSDEWTERAVMGWQMELGKLAAALTKE